MIALGNCSSLRAHPASISHQLQTDQNCRSTSKVPIAAHPGPKKVQKDHGCGSAGTVPITAQPFGYRLQRDHKRGSARTMCITAQPGPGRLQRSHCAALNCPDSPVLPTNVPGVRLREEASAFVVRL